MPRSRNGIGRRATRSSPRGGLRRRPGSWRAAHRDPDSRLLVDAPEVRPLAGLPPDTAGAPGRGREVDRQARRATAAQVSRRRSPKRGIAADVCAELVSFPSLLSHPNFTLEIALVEEEEIRRPDARKGWRRGGFVIEERRLVDVRETVELASPDALLAPGARRTTGSVHHRRPGRRAGTVPSRCPGSRVLPPRVRGRRHGRQGRSGHSVSPDLTRGRNGSPCRPRRTFQIRYPGSTLERHAVTKNPCVQCRPRGRS